jgi:hypothetical protein
MAGETDLHKRLKKEGCRWLFRNGYRSVAAEVRLPPLGIVDAVGTGTFHPWHNHICSPKRLDQTCIIECKASRADFLRDLSNDGQMDFALFERRQNLTTRRKRRFRQVLGLGKFDSCLMQPMANIHYILAPAGLLQKRDLPQRWGLLTLGEGGISVVVKAQWQEIAQKGYVESAIATTLTRDIYNADQRALNSINREIFAQQMSLADRIRDLKATIVLAPASSA